MPSNTWLVLSDVVIVLGAALLLGTIAERLRQSAVMGYLVAGVLLGPSGAALISSADQVRGLAELGVALLLFTIGLEFSWRRLRALGAMATAGGTLQVVVTTAVGAWVALAFGVPAAPAIVLGAGVALSSTAVVLRILTDRAELDGVTGRNALGILLLQDLAVVPLVLLVSALGKGALGLVELALFALGLGKAALLVAALFLLTRYIFTSALHWTSAYRNRDLPVVLALSFCLGAAVVSHSMDVSPILGAFVAGMCLAESPFAEQIRADLIPLRSGFLTLFFASLGMMVGWPAAESLPLVGGIILAVVAGKLTVILLIVRLLGQPWGIGVATGLTLAQIGEFSFVLLELAHRQELLAGQPFQLMLTVSAITLLLTPYLIASAPKAAEFVSRWLSPAGRRADREATPPAAHMRSRVIIVGFGPAGRRVAQAMEEEQIPFVVVDLNPRTVSADRSAVPMAFGDATRPEILQHLGLEAARALVVTIPDPQTAQTIIRQVKRLAPQVPVIARSRFHLHANALLHAGADALVDEEELVGVQLGSKVLGTPLRGEPRTIEEA